MISKEEVLKYMDLNRLYANEYEYRYYCYYIKCLDCPFSAKYNNGQTCRHNIKKYVEKKKKIKEIMS